MSDQKKLEAILPKLNAIPREQLLRPTMPVSIVLQESENAFKIAEEDRDILMGVGLNWQMVEELPDASDALRITQGGWTEQRFKQHESYAVWKQAAQKGYDLRDELVRAQRYAYSNHPDLLRQVTIIAKGNSHADMIQDLTDLSIQGLRNPEPLEDIKFDLEKLQLAASMAHQLADQYAESERDSDKDREAKVLRDRAYTLVKQTLDKVYAAGQYAFWDNFERQQVYRSYYKLQANRKYRNGAEETEATETTEATQADTEVTPAPEEAGV